MFGLKLNELRLLRLHCRLHRMLLFSVRCFCLFLQTGDLLLFGSKIFQPLCIRSGQCCLLLSFQLAVQGFLTTAHFLIKLLIANLGHDGCIASLIYREGFAAMGTFNFIHETSLLFIYCLQPCLSCLYFTDKSAKSHVQIVHISRAQCANHAHSSENRPI